MKLRWLVWWVMCLPLVVMAQQRLEIIPLQHRLPDQVLPALQALVEPGGSLTAAGNRLLLRASPANIAEIRAALAALDTPVRRLMISVRQGASGESATREAGIRTGRVVIGPDGRLRGEAELRADVRTTQGSQSVQQQVQTVEGGEAAIFLGQSLPLPMRRVLWRPDGVVVVSDSVQYVDVGSGFSARPELIGERVRLSIAPQMQRVGQGASIDGTRLATQVEGRLGEWIALGGGGGLRNEAQGAWGSTQRQHATSSAEVWLKVEVLP